MNAPDTSLTAPATDAANSPGDNRHYLRALTGMADRGNVLTHDAIYTDKGVKLVDKGTRV
ncbi:MAG: phosphohydrolase, partial [Proteobacteria bacterium]|nr:phosphohydrolase [Pseudomonadota bacterium]